MAMSADAIAAIETHSDDDYVNVPPSEQPDSRSGSKQDERPHEGCPWRRHRWQYQSVCVSIWANVLVIIVGNLAPTPLEGCGVFLRCAGYSYTSCNVVEAAGRHTRADFINQISNGVCLLLVVAVVSVEGTFLIRRLSAGRGLPRAFLIGLGVIGLISQGVVDFVSLQEDQFDSTKSAPVCYDKIIRCCSYFVFTLQGAALCVYRDPSPIAPDLAPIACDPAPIATDPAPISSLDSAALSLESDEAMARRLHHLLNESSSCHHDEELGLARGERPLAGQLTLGSRRREDACIECHVNPFDERQVSTVTEIEEDTQICQRWSDLKPAGRRSSLNSPMAVARRYRQLARDKSMGQLVSRKLYTIEESPLESGSDCADVADEGRSFELKDMGGNHAAVAPDTEKHHPRSRSEGQMPGPAEELDDMEVEEDSSTLESGIMTTTL